MLDDPAAGKKLVEVDNLKMHFPIYAGLMRRHVGDVKAVDGVSFDIYDGETLGLVGESGCGKSTCGRALLRLYELTDGTVKIDGVDIAHADPEELRQMRPTMQMVFQDPQASLNPRMTVASIIGEPLSEHTKDSKSKRELRIFELMDAVGLSRDFANRYPHEFSGGQRQRIGIARALALNPKFIICDEPIAALDVSIQAQVVNLLEDLQQKLGLTYLFISHDLGVVQHMCDSIAVMYMGKIVEHADRRSLFENPLHPYTSALLSAVPSLDKNRRAETKRILIPGDAPDPVDLPTGCRFANRCPVAQDQCRTQEPPLVSVANGHRIACHLVDETAKSPL
jgi:oligopeptide transport system ATP-binding protein